MARLNLLLLIAVIATALYLVHTQYQSRQLFTEFDRVQNEARRLELDGDRLQVEKRAQATPLRVEKLAKEQLKMRTTTPAITQYVRPDGSVIPAVVAPAPPASAAQPAKRVR
ncbi:cell division protein FtsL [Variovorax sp. PAMC 28711]|uniref:cell division protein FtsL n=1 Tax=Variovorax sp. PAMC 28711 TaxID=1795631 RepID=UPI00078C85F7|nr:cell division protein FtsL [Variovorax sp. PAMC 28711]AMM24115.1 cell division protein FtsL [Variovorax sp. PAMC 28711]